jgi:GNAT superfamily N-acetyltransferase
MGAAAQPSYEYTLNHCTLADREEFLLLWLRFAIEAHERLESPVLPSPANMSRWRLLWDSYRSGSLRGVTVCARDPGGHMIGCLMAGEIPDGFSLETTRGKLCEVWGVYTTPDWRLRGVSKSMYRLAVARVKELGFDGAVSLVRFNIPARQNSDSWGASRDAIVVYKDLR